MWRRAGFAWAVPVVRPEGFFVRIGVMAARDAPGCYRRMLERVGDRWGVSNRDLPPRLKILPLGAIDRTYADRLLAIGDAAGLVKPTTGGGIHYSIVSASIAADVALDALASDRLSAASLADIRTAVARRARGRIRRTAGAARRGHRTSAIRQSTASSSSLTPTASCRSFAPRRASTSTVPSFARSSSTRRRAASSSNRSSANLASLSRLVQRDRGHHREQHAVGRGA
jgi:flavin-dependent dehydrogenase